MYPTQAASYSRHMRPIEWTFDALPFRGILSRSSNKVSWSSISCFLAGFHANISTVLAYRKHILLGTRPMTVIDNPLQECDSAREISF